jgi:hypothetical protein
LVQYVWNGKTDITLPSSEKDKSENHGYDDDNDSKRGTHGRTNTSTTIVALARITTIIIVSYKKV